MKKELLAYVAGLCQAASAALLAAAFIAQGQRPLALFGCYLVSIVGIFLVFLKNKES